MKDYELMDSKEIQEIRVAVRKRQKYKCLFCNGDLEKIGMSNSVHHIIPKAFGGELSLDNCICICSPCHRKIETLNKILITGSFNYFMKQYGLETKFKQKKLENTHLFAKDERTAP